MTALRILHVDDEPDIREVVEISLNLDPEFTVRNCSSGRDAVAAAAEWSPDLIILDVMMPGMDGPATLQTLREDPRTSAIPVIFMTARAQPSELAHFRALGAEGVIAKPFDPLTLAASVRQQMQASKGRLNGARARFLARAREDATSLGRERLALSGESDTGLALERIRTIAHRLAGGGGTAGYAEISGKALDVEQAASDMRDGACTVADLNRTIDALVDRIQHA